VTDMQSPVIIVYHDSYRQGVLSCRFGNYFLKAIAQKLLSTQVS